MLCKHAPECKEGEVYIYTTQCEEEPVTYGAVGSSTSDLSVDNCP